MAIEFSSVDVWVGDVLSQTVLMDLFKETYSEDDDETPISKFAAAQGQWFYDHDFLEALVFERTADLPAAINRCSFAKSYVEAVALAHEKMGRPSVNAVVLAFGAVIREPKSFSSEQYRFVYVGRFRSEPGA